MVDAPIGATPDDAFMAVPGQKFQVTASLSAVKTSSEDANIMAAQLFAKHPDVEDSVLIGEEDVLPIVAPLRDVMRHARDYETRSARHTR